MAGASDGVIGVVFCEGGTGEDTSEDVSVCNSPAIGPVCWGLNREIEGDHSRGENICQIGGLH